MTSTGVDEHASRVSPEAILALHQYQPDMGPEVIPGLYLPYAQRTSAMDLIPVPDWYESFFKRSTQYPHLAGIDKRKKKIPRYQDPSGMFKSWYPHNTCAKPAACRVIVYVLSTNRPHASTPILNSPNMVMIYIP